MIVAGYNVKIIAPRPPEIPIPEQVQEICSASSCISKGPQNERWYENWFGWFNSEAEALSAIRPGEEPGCRLFAYRFYPFIFKNSGAVEPFLPAPTGVEAEPIPESYKCLGFDSVSRWRDDVWGIECSPLSCNYMAARFEVNRFCLFPDLKAAIKGAEAFSIEQPEPGNYFIVEVLERAKPF